MFNNQKLKEANRQLSMYREFHIIVSEAVDGRGFLSSEDTLDYAIKAMSYNARHDAIHKLGKRVRQLNMTQQRMQEKVRCMKHELNVINKTSIEELASLSSLERLQTRAQVLEAELLRIVTLAQGEQDKYPDSGYADIMEEIQDTATEMLDAVGTCLYTSWGKEAEHKDIKSVYAQFTVNVATVLDAYQEVYKEAQRAFKELNLTVHNLVR